MSTPAEEKPTDAVEGVNIDAAAAGVVDPEIQESEIANLKKNLEEVQRDKDGVPIEPKKRYAKPAGCTRTTKKAQLICEIRAKQEANKFAQTDGEKLNKLNYQMLNDILSHIPEIEEEPEDPEKEDEPVRVESQAKPDIQAAARKVKAIDPRHENTPKRRVDPRPIKRDPSPPRHVPNSGSNRVVRQSSPNRKQQKSYYRL